MGPASGWKRPYGEGRESWQGGNQSSRAISSGDAGRPGTVYPSLNHCARSRSRQRAEQNGAKSALRDLRHIGQVLAVLISRPPARKPRQDRL